MTGIHAYLSRSKTSAPCLLHFLVADSHNLKSFVDTILVNLGHDNGRFSSEKRSCPQALVRTESHREFSSRTGPPVDVQRALLSSTLSCHLFLVLALLHRMFEKVGDHHEFCSLLNHNLEDSKKKTGDKPERIRNRTSQVLEWHYPSSWSAVQVHMLKGCGMDIATR